MNQHEQPLSQMIARLWGKIPQSGDLQTWLPYHALESWQDLPFEAGIAQAYEQLLAAPSCASLAEVNRLSLVWLSLYFDEKQAGWGLPGRTADLYHSILVTYQWHARDKQKVQCALGSSPQGLINLVAPKQRQELFCERLLHTLPGWASFVRYQSQIRNTPHWQEQFLALRCFWAWEAGLDPQELLSPTPQLEQLSHALGSLHEYEAKREAQLRATLAAALDKYKVSKLQSEAHFVFCIDVRSEPLRRLIAEHGPYTSDGLAGFLGMDIALRHPISGKSYHLCPTILQPQQEVVGEQQLSGGLKALWNQCLSLDVWLKKQLLTPLLWVECWGVVCGLMNVFLSLGLEFWRQRPAVADPDLKLPSQAHTQIPLAQKVAYASGLLSALSCQKLPPVVVLCSHGATVINNIFEAKLQCGACGNYRGMENARLMVQILSEPKTQASLGQQYGWDLSETTFVAAEHDTVSDALHFFDVPLSLKSQPRWIRLTQALAQAQQKNQSRRAAVLGSHSQGYHWAQARPEWGLAGHQALLIGPASWAAEADLNGQVFLHSYDYLADPSGDLLGKIMAGPIQVGYLINMQYLFPSFDPSMFAAGNKMLHQLSMGCMVTQGNGSDLMIGVPEQSVLIAPKQRYHQPCRLLLIFYCPKDQLMIALSQQPPLLWKLAHRWLQLMAYDPEKKSWYRWEDIAESFNEKQSLKQIIVA